MKHLRALKPYKEFILLWIFLIGIAVPLFAVTNATTNVSFAVKCLDQSCEYFVTFTGDDNASNSFLVQYRVHGTSTWINAYRPFIDRRGDNPGTSGSNPYYRTARGQIFWLTANTSYDFQVTTTDADGVSGSNPMTPSDASASSTQPTACSGGSCSTYNTSPTIGAGNCTVNNDTDFSNAVSGSCAHVTINAFTYGPAAGSGNSVWSRSGSAGASIWLDCQSGAKFQAVTAGGADLYITGNFVLVTGCDFPQSLGSALSDFGHDNVIRGNTMDAVNHAASASDCNTGTYYDQAGLFIGDNAYNVYGILNQIAGDPVLDSIGCSPVYSSPGEGIRFCNVAHISLHNNTVTKSFRDGITADSDCQTENIVLQANTVSGQYDDPEEIKGWQINVAIVQGTEYVMSSKSSGSNGMTCWALNTGSLPIYGPAYILRSQCYADFAGAGGQTVFKTALNGTYFLSHNSFNDSCSSCNWDGTIQGFGGFVDSFNNIIRTAGGNIYVSGSTGVITALTFAGSGTGVTAGTYTDKKPTSGTTSCVQAITAGTFDQLFNVTVAASAFTVVQVGFGGYGGCVVNDTLKIPGTAFTGGATPANDLTITITKVGGYVGDTNTFRQWNSANNIGKQWDNTSGSSSPTTINYANIAAFRTGTGQDTNSITTDPTFQNGVTPQSMVILSSSTAACVGTPQDNFDGTNTPYPYSCAGNKPSIGYYEPNLPAGSGSNGSLLRQGVGP